MKDESENHNDQFPTSPFQDRLFFLDSLYDGLTAYNLPTAIKIHGNISTDFLKQAINYVLQKHRIFRVYFQDDNGVITQRLHHNIEPNIESIDLSHLSTEKQNHQMHQSAATICNKHFDLHKDLLIRFCHYILADNHHILLVNVHHIIFDGKSLRIFLDDLASFYNALENHRTITIAPPKEDYLTHSLNKRRPVDPKIHNESVNYWLHMLAGCNPVHSLQLDMPRPKQQAFIGRQEHFVIEQELFDKLKGLAKTQGSTLFHVLYSALACLYYKYTSSNDLIIGVPVDTRDPLKEADIIGYFVNTLPVRVQLDENLKFSELLLNIKDLLFDVLEHSDIPFGEIVEKMNITPDLSLNPLIQLTFDYSRMANIVIADKAFDFHEFDMGKAQFDIDLHIREHSNHIDCFFEYNTSIFTKDTINNLISSFIQLLNCIIDDPHKQITNLEVLSDQQKQTLLYDWNRTDSPIPELCVHELFEAQVKKTPDNIAAVFEDQSLTYQQLNKRANQVANYLLEQDIHQNDLIGVYLNRSIDLLAALFAIAKAGAAYVPLDPNYPQQRIQHILEQTQLKLIVSHSSLETDLPNANYKSLLLDKDQKHIAAQSTENIGLDYQPANLAYVIFTSGSTGKPKGIEIQHAALSAFLHAMQAELNVSSDDRLLAVTTITFDIAGLELFLPLTSGASVCIATNKQSHDPQQLDHLLKNDITLMQATPVTWKLLFDNGWVGSRKLTALCGGEALPIELAQLLTQKTAKAYNFYGPTETTIWSSVKKLESELTQLTIGRPLANECIYILDDNLNPVPVGVPGEIHIGGSGLAKGYFNKPQLTHQNFIADPFKSNQRLYKTGDLGRFLASGEIEYLGRTDNQVKIRGFRIECGEIEAVLKQLPAVNNALVTAVDINDDKHLAAYIVYHEQPLDDKSLREVHRQLLPDYMIPSYFITLDELPLTPNGKIDRKALPLPDPSQLQLTNKFVAPSNPTEELIATIWQDVLNINRIGIYDNFFELGGHSLIATQVISRLRQTLRIDLPLKVLFESPTIAYLATHLNQADKTSLPPIESQLRDAPIPLSFAQERLWFLDQLDGSSATYNIPAAWVITGDLNHSALELALAEILSRHETLRTRFINQQGTPYQVIEATAEFNLPVTDLSDLSIETANQQAMQLATDEAQLAFNLETDLPFRAQLINLADKQHVLLITLHHIAFDGWSLDLLMRELATLYNAFSHDQDSPLPELAIQYADFALWQRTVFDEAHLAKDIEYWQQTLAGCEFILDLPTDFPRPQQQTHNGQQLLFSLSPELTQSLEQLARAQNATLFMVLFAAFNVLLSRFSNQHDIVVGSPIAGRTHESIENLMGFFVNTLVLRTDLSDNPSFLELIEQVRQHALDAYAHQDIPFEKLVEVLQPERDTSRSPLFQVMFVLQSQYQGLPEFDELELASFSRNSSTTKFDLLLNFYIDNKQLHGIFEFNTDLFLPESIERIRDCFTELLQSIVNTPEHSLSELNSIPAYQSLLLEQWNQTSTPIPDQCVHQLFEKRVETTPDQIALVQDQQSLSYKQLNQKANQLAHYLKQQGVASDDIIAVYLGRCMDTVVCLLGILKSGAAYLPLDPNYPKARLEHMINDSKAKLIITNEMLNAQLPSTETSRLLIDSEYHNLENQAIVNLAQSVSLNNLSYIIYTSGSTGKPKGVAVPHETLSNLLAWHIDICKQPKTVLQFAALSFDISLLECFTAWLSGGKLCMITSEQHQDIASLASIIAQHSINMITFPVVVLQQFAQMHINKLSELTSLTDIISSGEQLQISPAITQFFKAMPHCKLHNQYGPSESHVVTAYTLDSDPMCWDVYPSIGKPIYNTQIHLLDRFQQPVPIGVVGELYIGGRSLAREYLYQPQMTAEKFITSPFNPSERLYKTGDLARYLPDGNIGYLGRADQQVKLRGFRIECGEIEALLLEHDEVNQVAVTIKTINNDKSLVAYYVCQHKGSQQIIQQLRNHLSQHLPNYMLPSFFIELEAMPLSPSGKVDNKALPIPNTNSLQTTNEFVSPTNPLEELVASIWQDILKRDRVGVHDNFFELGGHSLIATQVISRVRLTTDTEVPLKALFENPTIAGFVEQIEQADKTSLPPIESQSRDAPIPLSFAQERLWFLDQLDGSSATYNIPAAWVITGDLNHSALELALAEILSRHETLRTRFINQQGTPYQVIEATAEFNLPVTDLSDLSIETANQQAMQLATDEAQLAFNLETDLPFRAQLINLADKQHVLLITLHHIAFDGWSLDLLMRELATLYNAFSHDQDSPLPELAIQYADFALWQRTVFDEAHLAKDIEYWQQTLAGCGCILDLPTDFQRPQQQTHNGQQLLFSLSPELTQSLEQLARVQNATLFMVLFAAFNVLLGRFSNQHDIVVGTPIAGRTHESIENLMGFFVNTLVLRTDLSDNPSFLELIEQVRQHALDAYAHQDIPFEKLVEVLQPERDTSRSPLFQVMFVLQSQYQELHEFDELELAPLPKDHTTAKFDLTLGLIQQDHQLQGGFEFNIDLFLPATIKRLQDCFIELLQDIVREPESKIAQLNLLPQAQQQQLLAWNQTEKSIPEHCVHQLFEQQVEKTPDNIAVVFEDQSLTYQQLNERANQLARYLQQQGVGPETLVGVYLERSLDMIVSLLAILKAGGAYLPLDTSYPASRTIYMLEDSKTRHLVTNSELSNTLSIQALYLITLDSLQKKLQLLPTQNLELPVSLSNLVYVIYTSGSTGKPKGVCIQHTGLLNLISWHQDIYQITTQDRATQFANFSFDASVWETWPYLTAGASLYLTTRDTMIEPNAIWDFLQKNKITLAFLPTPIAQVCLEQPIPSPLSLRALLTGGDKLESLNHELLPFTLVNHYGPTENSVVSTFTAVDLKKAAIKSPSIGKPINNVKTYILDENLNPTPIGVSGELFVAGKSLANGYLYKPKLTKERFIQNPHHKDERLYRTGDLARYLPDGNIEFLGRIDNQVKIRGFRIECGEIETVLTELEAINNALVMAADINNDKHLVAYIVYHDQPLSDSALRDSLKRQLPDYMVPSYFIALDAFPLTPNGKIDRKQLPIPDRVNIARESYAPPQTPLEHTIAAVWMQLLAVDKIDRRDNFFDLGGHSLLSIKVIYHIQEAAEVQFNPTDFIFNNLQQLAAMFEHDTSTAVEQQIESEVIKPAYLNLGDKQLFTCIHYPAINSSKKGVMICNPIGHEYQNYHRPLKQLAQLLSQNGYPVMRFDYYGSGDSSGETTELTLSHCLTDIDVIVKSFKSQSLLDEICLVGARIGSSLALKYAEQYGDIAELVLWSPLGSGAEYLQQLSTLSQQQNIPYSIDYQCQQTPNTSLELFGHQLSDQLLNEINSLTATQTETISSRTLLISDSQFKLNASDKVQFIKTDDANIWKLDPSKMVVPKKLLTQICEWLKQ